MEDMSTSAHATAASDKDRANDENNETTEEPEISQETIPPDLTSFKTHLSKFKYSTPNTNPEDHSPSPRRTTPRKRPPSPHPIPSPPPSSQTPKKKRKPSPRYAPPSKYAHLPPLTDILAPCLITLFVGTNPGIRTATTGHAYSHPSNLFWKLLHSSGCTPEARLSPHQDVDLPRLYCMGNTNIVERPTRDAGELSKKEMSEGAPVLDEKVRKWRPESVCIVGKGIWEAVWRWRYGRELKKGEFEYGWQGEKENMGVVDGEWEGARVFVASSTSGLSASLRPHEKEAIWRPFGEWVKGRRLARFGVEGRLPNS